MEGPVSPIPAEPGWYPDESPEQAGKRARKRPSARPPDAKETDPLEEDYYTPSEPEEEP